MPLPFLNWLRWLLTAVFYRSIVNSETDPIMTIILGLNAYHGDASAALVRNGVLLSAVEEERFNRIKHWAGFPIESIKYCLENAGIGIEDVNHVAISFNPRANLAAARVCVQPFAIRKRHP